MVNHDAPHQLRGGRDKVGPALPEGFRIIAQRQVGFVENDGGLRGVAGTFPAHVMVGEPVQFGLHQRKQLLERCFVSAAPVAEQLGDLLSRRWGRRHTDCSTLQILPRSTCNSCTLLSGTCCRAPLNAATHRAPAAPVTFSSSDDPPKVFPVTTIVLFSPRRSSS